MSKMRHLCEPSKLLNISELRTDFCVQEVSGGVPPLQTLPQAANAKIECGQKFKNAFAFY
jgi:hypothetical protein